MNRQILLMRLLAVAAMLSALGCGPELTALGTGNVSGAWTSAGPTIGLSGLTIELMQDGSGGITGTYTGTYNPTDAPGRQICPSDQPCSISGTVVGSNTALEVLFELSNVGRFTGQVYNDGTMPGTMSRDTYAGKIRFTRAPQVLAGAHRTNAQTTGGATSPVTL